MTSRCQPQRDGNSERETETPLGDDDGRGGERLASSVVILVFAESALAAADAAKTDANAWWWTICGSVHARFDRVRWRSWRDGRSSAWAR